MPVKILGYKELQDAIKKNPAVVVSEARNYFMRALAEYKSVVRGTPWRVGGSGGGSPVSKIKGGRLLQAHGTKLQKFSASYGVTGNVPYAGYVHGGTYKMERRPWLDYAIQQKDNKVKSLETNMLRNIIEQLAK